ncbi:MAG: hypothetical protein EPO21_13100 [Chloroflexota bacterium]|nr:MAG: hypothetical protein EPO21_13100 [Chloroflexota bacterium]
MTADEYRAWFAENYGLSVELQHELNLEPVRCDCGGTRPGCTGWQMERVSHLHIRRSNDGKAKVPTPA